VMPRPARKASRCEVDSKCLSCIGIAIPPLGEFCDLSLSRKKRNLLWGKRDDTRNIKNLSMSNTTPVFLSRNGRSDRHNIPSSKGKLI
jgi:hypothetical protein